LLYSLLKFSINDPWLYYSREIAGIDFQNPAKTVQ
jgi:hypothetical protein